MAITQELKQARDATSRYVAVIYDCMGNPLGIWMQNYQDLAIMTIDNAMKETPYADHAVIYWHDWQWMPGMGLVHTYNPSVKRTASSSEWEAA